MAVTRELEVVRVDLNDEYGVSLWVRKKLTELTPDEAVLLADELMRAAAQATALEEQDRLAAFDGQVCQPLRVEAEGVL